MNYLDGNAAAGELSRIFAMDITSAEGQSQIAAQRSALPKRIYMCSAPAWLHGCALCGHVVLRCVNTQQHIFLDLRGMTYLALDTTEQQEASS